MKTTGDYVSEESSSCVILVPDCRYFGFQWIACIRKACAVNAYGIMEKGVSSLLICHDNGVRFNWNVFPSTREDEISLAYPLACLYQPLYEPTSYDFVEFSHWNALVSCPSCNTFLNRFSQLDRKSGLWTCVFCGKRSLLPRALLSDVSHYHDDLHQHSTKLTMIYNLPSNIDSDCTNGNPFCFVFIVDIYCSVQDIEDSKRQFDRMVSELCKCLDILPQNCLIGLITFDDAVHMHKVNGSGEITVFSPDEINEKAYSSFFSLNKNFFGKHISDYVLRKLFVKEEIGLPFDWNESDLVKCGYFSVNKDFIVRKMKQLKPRFVNNSLPLRSTGLAVYLAAILLAKASFKSCIGRVFIFSNGVPTCEPGNILRSSSSKGAMRSHYDIHRLNAPLSGASNAFYKALSYVANGLEFETSGHVATSVSSKTTDYFILQYQPKFSFGIYCASLDQVGFYEMRPLVLNTNGPVVLADSYLSNSFWESFNSSILCWLESKSGATFRVIPSEGLKIQKLIGHHYSLPPLRDDLEKIISDKSTKFDSTMKKKTFTNHWSFVNLSPHDTMSLYFDIDFPNYSLSANYIEEFFLQFQLKYFDHSLRSWKLRVTTVSVASAYLSSSISKLQFPKGGQITSKVINKLSLLESLDSEAWVILLARLLIHRVDTSIGYDNFDTLKDLIDGCIIQLQENFGHLTSSLINLFQSQNPYGSMLNQFPNSLSMREGKNFLPYLVYNLRKNPRLIEVFNSSPDQISYFHYIFMRADYNTSSTIICPNLYKITKKEYQEIPLEVLYLQLGVFYVMDTVYYVVIYQHTDLSRLFEGQKLHPSNNEHLININAGLEEPLNFIRDQIRRKFASRNQIPWKYIITQKGHSQSRYFYSNMNSSENSFFDVS